MASILNLQEGAILEKETFVSEFHFNSNLVLLQTCPDPHIMFYRLKHYCIKLKKKKRKRVKMIIPSNITNHVAFEISVQIIAIVHPYFHQQISSPSVLVFWDKDSSPSD